MDTTLGIQRGGHMIAMFWGCTRTQETASLLPDLGVQHQGCKKSNAPWVRTAPIQAKKQRQWKRRSQRVRYPGPNLHRDSKMVKMCGSWVVKETPLEKFLTHSLCPKAWFLLCKGR